MAKTKKQEYDTRRISIRLRREQWELVEELGRGLKVQLGFAAGLFFCELEGAPKTLAELRTALDAYLERRQIECAAERAAERKRPRLRVVKG